MAENIKFEAPPVVETALSVQFDSLPGFSAAHVGWFWKEYIEKLADGSHRGWKQVAETVGIPDQFEKFGADDVWRPLSIQVTQGQIKTRVQIIREDRERMIQIQNTRFILNWQKQSSAYPSYETLLPEFRDILHAFESFCAEAGLGVPRYNQWEVVYVDQVKRGNLWHSARDLGQIFPGLSVPPTSSHYTPPSGDETVSADWRFSLADRRGRLYLSFRQLRVPPLNEEVINLTTTARGPVNDSQSWEQGLNFGHDALRETFLAMTSSEAKEYWRKAHQ